MYIYIYIYVGTRPIDQCLRLQSTHIQSPSLSRQVILLHQANNMHFNQPSKANDIKCALSPLGSPLPAATGPYWKGSALCRKPTNITKRIPHNCKSVSQDSAQRRRKAAQKSKGLTVDLVIMLFLRGRGLDRRMLPASPSPGYKLIRDILSLECTMLLQDIDLVEPRG